MSPNCDPLLFERPWTHIEDFQKRLNRSRDVTGPVLREIRSEIENVVIQNEADEFYALILVVFFT